MEWSNEKVIAFLRILKTEPCLWDPKLKSFKNRSLQNDAWRRIIQLLPFRATIEGMKKKKESLMCYYRTHLNKYKKYLKSGAGEDEYCTNWFAFEAMDSFLRGIYDSNHTLRTELNDCRQYQVRNELKKDANEKSPQGSPEIKASRNKQTENITRSTQSKSPDCARKRRPRDDLPPEIRAAGRHTAFEYTTEKICDEYEIFGRLIATKIKKIKNPNTRDMLMNDIHNLVFRTCVADRHEQESAVTPFPTSLSPYQQIFLPSPNPSSCQSPLGTTSMSPHHQVFSPSPNPSSCHSLPDPTTSLSPHH